MTHLILHSITFFLKLKVQNIQSEHIVTLFIFQGNQLHASAKTCNHHFFSKEIADFLQK